MNPPRPLPVTARRIIGGTGRGDKLFILFDHM